MSWVQWRDRAVGPSNWRVSVAPVIEPVTVGELRQHCRIDHTDEDELLVSYLIASRSWCEEYCRRSFITQTIQLRRPRFSSPMDLPRGPVQSVTSVKYQDQDDVQQTLSTDVYEFVDDPVMARVGIRWNQNWPITALVELPVLITYVAGYGSTAASVPVPIRQAIKMMAAQMYEFREPLVAGTTVATVPMAVEALLGPYRVLGSYE